MQKSDLMKLDATSEFLAKVGGEHAPELVRICLERKKDCKDEDINKKMPELKITEIRTILNQLHYRGIACYNKTRNQKSGWYTFTWTIETKRIAELLLEQKTEELEKMQHKMDIEQQYETYACPKECNPTVFEVAVEYQFRCPECGKSMAPQDTKKLVRQKKKEVAKIEKEVKTLQKYI